MKQIKLAPGAYEYIDDNGAMKYRIYKNRWNGWTLAVFSELHKQFIDSRYFSTMKQAKSAVWR